MQIKTEVKATINQIKQLIAEKYNISIDFDLEIMEETVQVGNFVGKQDGELEITPWYPDNSGEWVEVEIGKGKPAELSGSCFVDILTIRERKNEKWESMPELASTWSFTNTVAYKKVK